MTRNTRLLLIGLAFVLLVGLIPVVAPRLMIGAVALPTLLVITTAGVILFISAVSSLRAPPADAKRKRNSDDPDTLAVIESLVDSLSDEERALLRAQLTEASPEADLIADDEPALEKPKQQALR